MTKEEFITALNKANEDAQQINNIEDGGYCVSDCVYFKLPEGIKPKDVKDLENVSKVMYDNSYKGYYMFEIKYNSQTFRRRQMAEVASKSLEESGIYSFVKYIED